MSLDSPDEVDVASGKVMWDDIKQQQLDELRRQEAAGALSDDDRLMLDQLISELEQEEWAALRPALDRLGKQQTDIERECDEARAQNAELAAIAQRQADLLTRARAQLNALLAEQAMLKSELERALSQ
ncbi:MAG: hypothetical protein AB1631_19355 [Acidobacteriota bacterium]